MVLKYLSDPTHNLWASVLMSVCRSLRFSVVVGSPQTPAVSVNPIVCHPVSSISVHLQLASVFTPVDVEASRLPEPSLFWQDRASSLAPPFMLYFEAAHQWLSWPFRDVALTPSSYTCRISSQTAYKVMTSLTSSFVPIKGKYDTIWIKIYANLRNLFLISSTDLNIWKTNKMAKNGNSYVQPRLALQGIVVSFKI